MISIALCRDTDQSNRKLETWHKLVWLVLRAGQNAENELAVRVERTGDPGVSITRMIAARWLTRLDDRMAAKLANVGLLPQRGTARLGAFLDEYINKRNDVKPSTKMLWGYPPDSL